MKKSKKEKTIKKKDSKRKYEERETKVNSLIYGKGVKNQLEK